MNQSDDSNINWLNTISKTIKKRSNTQIVLDMLEEAMLRKELLPGQLLPSESALSTSLNISKSSVREAIKMLEGVGVIKVIHGKGSFIHDTFKDVGSNLLAFQLILAKKTPQELIEFRYLFEPMYMNLAMQKVTKVDLEELKQYLDIFKQKIKNNLQISEDDSSFHNKILEITDNSIIISIGKIINKMLCFSFSKAVYSHPKTVYQDHLKIYKALHEKNQEKLNTVIKTILDKWAHHFQQ